VAKRFVDPILAALPQAQAALGRQPDTFTYVAMGWGLFEQTWRIRGFENALMDAVEDPGFYTELVGKIADVYVDMVRACAGHGADAFFFGDDWGDQRGVILGLTAFAALAISFGLVLLFEYLDDTIKSKEDFDRYVGLPFLGFVPHIDAEETDYGVRIISTRKTEQDRTFFRVTNFIIPNKATIPGPMSGDGYNLYWHVPIDDTHHWRYDIVFRRSGPMEEKDIQRNQEILDELGPNYRPLRNKTNRYLQDRESMKTWSFAGMGRIFNVQDTAIVEGSGAIVDRTREFLGPSDRAIILARRQMLRAIRDVEAGREAPHVARTEEKNRYPDLTVISEVITDGTDWHAHWKNKLAGLE